MINPLLLTGPSIRRSSHGIVMRINGLKFVKHQLKQEQMTLHQLCLLQSQAVRPQARAILLFLFEIPQKSSQSLFHWLQLFVMLGIEIKLLHSCKKCSTMEQLPSSGPYCCCSRHYRWWPDTQQTTLLVLPWPEYRCLPPPGSLHRPPNASGQ